MMKRTSIYYLIIISFSIFPITHAENLDLSLWYTEPAGDWLEALPVGNGRLGAMVFGGIEKERIQFNEDSLWTGVPRDYINPKALEALPKVRQLLFEGKQREAEKVAMDMMSIPLRQEAYQPFGDLHLHFPGHAGATSYRRELDLATGKAITSYQVGDTVYRREVFASYPDQVIVISITASQPNAISLSVSMDSPHKGCQVASDTKEANAAIRLQGRLQRYFNERTKEQKDSVLAFESRVQIARQGGDCRVNGNGLTITNANAVTLKLAAATSYKNFRDIGHNPSALCEKTIQAVEAKSAAELAAAHRADYQALFNRVSVDFGTSEAATQPTDVRIKNFAAQDDPGLPALYLHYGRYLLIASSRPGSQPANLQGIWNQELTPPWDSKWTVNINTEMNYWPAEMCNLSECHEPLFAMLEDLVVTGGAIAREHYNCRGWVLHHNTDVWRGAAPINATNHGIWMTGGAWLSQHLWLRYAYSQDTEFLATRAYPIMKGAALFFTDFLVEDPKTGWLISTPSNSPENGGLVAGPTMDHQIIRNLLSHCITASDILGIDGDLRKQWQAIRTKIAPNQIGQHGQLQEWLEDKDDPKNTHRHVSHLWGLHPGNEISPIFTPELAEACKVTLAHRGDGGTGWSKAWKVNFWARLHDGNHAYKMFSELIDKSTLPNMFDTHPPFQIDGNFGGASGLTEMLLQSQNDELHLLPALPDALPYGRVNGLLARGGFAVAMHWQDGKLQQAQIQSNAGQPLALRYAGITKTYMTKQNEMIVLDGALQRVE
jgi:alpha-L-fucosidase 2